jgi:hypothetical protein
VKLGPFIAGAFGTVGFGLSVLAGLGAGNTVEHILTTGLVWAGVCYAVGYAAGLIAQQVALEHARRVAQLVAEQDAKAAAAGEAAKTDAAGAAVPGSG